MTYTGNTALQKTGVMMTMPYTWYMHLKLLKEIFFMESWYLRGLTNTHDAVPLIFDAHD